MRLSILAEYPRGKYPLHTEGPHGWKYGKSHARYGIAQSDDLRY